MILKVFFDTETNVFLPNILSKKGQ